MRQVRGSEIRRAVCGLEIEREVRGSEIRRAVCGPEITREARGFETRGRWGGGGRRNDAEG